MTNEKAHMAHQTAALPAHALVLLSINQHTKVKVPSLTNSKDMITASKKLSGSRDPITLLSGVVCISPDSTCYDTRSLYISTHYKHTKVNAKWDGLG